MARVLLDEAAVRVGADTRGGEADSRRAGERFGREFAQGATRKMRRADFTAQLVSQVEAASGRVAQARGAEEAAAGRVRVAELKLQELRDAGNAKASQLAAAEERLADAQRALTRAQGATSRETGRLTTAQDRLASAHDDASTATDRHTKANQRLRNSLDATFLRQVEAELNKISKVAAINIPLTAGGERLRRQIGAQIAEIERTMHAEIPVDPEQAAEFRRKLALQVRDASRTIRANINVDVNQGHLSRITGFFRTLGGLGAQTGKTFGALASSGSKLGGILTRAFGGAAEQASSFGSAMGGAGSIVTKVGPGIALAIGNIALSVAKWYTKMAPMAALIGLVAGAATAAAGAVTAAVAGLPVVLSTAIAPIAAVALGFDGITRAAKTLSPEVDALRKSLSTVLEHEFLIVFERLRPIFPVLERGLLGVAVSVGHFAQDLTGVVTSAEGLRHVEAAIRGSGVALDRIAPSAAEVLRQVLAIAGTEPLYVIFGDTVGGLADRFAGFLQRLRESGTLQRALEQLRDVLFSASDAVFALAEGATEFFASSGPGIAGFFDGLAAALGNIDWERFGAAFGRIMQSLGDGLARIPPETWNALAESVEGFATSVQSFIDSGALNALVGGFASLVSWASFLLDGLGLLVSPIESVLGAFGFLGEETQMASGNLDTLNTKTTETGGYFDSLGVKLAEVAGGIPAPFEAATTETGGYFDQLAAKLSENTDLVATKSGEMSAQFGQNMSTLPPQGEAATGDLLTVIARGMGTITGTMMRLSAEAVHGTAGWFSQLPGRVGVHAAITVGNIRSAFIDMKDTMVRLSKEAAVGAITNIYEIPSRLRGLKDELRLLGVSMIQGLIDGITSMATRVAQKAVEVVVNATDAAKRALNARSPSRVWARMGRDTIQGYILGLRERLAPLIAQIQAMFAQAGAAAEQALRGAVVDIPLGSISDATWDRLRAMGYRGDPTDRREALVDVPLSALREAQRVTSPAPAAVLAPGDMQQMAGLFAAAMGGMQLEFVGPSVVQVVRSDNRLVARR